MAKLNRAHPGLGSAALGTILVLASVPGVSAQTPQQKATDILQGSLHSKNLQERQTAVRVLGLLRNESWAVEEAEKALQDEKPEVRTAAATALGNMEAKSSAPRLSDAMEDKEPAVALAAAHALLTMGDPAGYEFYYEVLTGERRVKGKGKIAKQIKTLHDKKKLAELGFEQGIGYMPFAGIGWEAIKAMTKQEKDEALPVRAAAAKELAKDTDPTSGAALAKAALGKQWLVRAAALDSLAKRGDATVLNDILPAMSDDKMEVRLTAAAAVLRLSATTPKAEN